MKYTRRSSGFPSVLGLKPASSEDSDDDIIIMMQVSRSAWQSPSSARRRAFRVIEDDEVEDDEESERDEPNIPPDGYDEEQTVEDDSDWVEDDFDELEDGDLANGGDDGNDGGDGALPPDADDDYDDEDESADRQPLSGIVKAVAAVIAIVGFAVIAGVGYVYYPRGNGNTAVARQADTKAPSNEHGVTSHEALTPTSSSDDQGRSKPHDARKADQTLELSLNGQTTSDFDQPAVSTQADSPQKADAAPGSHDVKQVGSATPEQSPSARQSRESHSNTSNVANKDSGRSALPPPPAFGTFDQSDETDAGGHSSSDLGLSDLETDSQNESPSQSDNASSSSQGAAPNTDVSSPQNKGKHEDDVSGNAASGTQKEDVGAGNQPMSDTSGQAAVSNSSGAEDQSNSHEEDVDDNADDVDAPSDKTEADDASEITATSKQASANADANDGQEHHEEAHPSTKVAKESDATASPNKPSASDSEQASADANAEDEQHHHENDQSDKSVKDTNDATTHSEKASPSEAEGEVSKLTKTNAELEDKIASLKKTIHQINNDRELLLQKLKKRPTRTVHVKSKTTAPYPTWRVIATTNHDSAVIMGPGGKTKVVHTGQKLWNTHVTKIDPKNQAVYTAEGVIRSH